jgi:hypothetical protein
MDHRIFHRYVACNPLSKQHNLDCGQKIETTEPMPCGTTCLRPGHDQPFICRACIIREVVIGLDMVAEDDVQTFDYATMGNIAEALVEEEMEARESSVDKLCRDSTVPSTNGLVQLFHDHPEARTLMNHGMQAPTLAVVEAWFDSMGINENVGLQDAMDVLQALSLEDGVDGEMQALSLEEPVASGDVDWENG